MGLDAWVFCDCVEKNRLKNLPPFADLIKIDPSGDPVLETNDREKLDAYSSWYDSQPCEHRYFQLIHRRLGNIGLVASFRASVKKLSPDPLREFPVFFGKVIYTGSHCGDYLTLLDVGALKKEISVLGSKDLHSLEPDPRVWFQKMMEDLSQLIKASETVGKPIAF